MKKLWTEYYKDWRFWFKIFVIVLLLFALLIDYLESFLNLDQITFTDEQNKVIYPWAVYDQSGNITAWNYAGYTMHWISFFTTQTNVFVLIWFIIAAIKHLQEGKSKILNSYFSLAVITYITVTCLIYNFLLLPAALISNNALEWTGWRWTAQMILHTFGPILSVLYVVVFAKHLKLLSIKMFYRQKIGWFFIYPIIYGIYGVIKGILCEYSGMNTNIAYQYFFLQVTNPSLLGMPGYVWFIIAILLICGIIIAFSTLYNFAYLRLEKIQNNKITANKVKNN